jgi:hypothetical protein
MNFGAIGNLAHRLSLVRKLPPRLVLAKIAKRLPWTDKRSVRVAEIVHSPKDLQPDRLIGFFQTQEAFLQSHGDWAPLDFAGRTVLEIGPGPLAGWGPMAVFRGAERVYGVDPDWVEGAFADPAVEAAYLKPHFEALVRAYGALMDYPTFRSRVRERLVVDRVGLADAAPGFRADIAISNSCLEHISGLQDALSALRGLCGPEARFMHLVNFGNHRNRAAPFETIYEMTPEDYRLRYGGHINLLRAPDVGRAFAGAGIDAHMVVVDRPVELAEAVAMHGYWRERYTLDEVSIRTALFVSAGARDRGTRAR